MEFPAYSYRLIPSLTGAENLMVMGIFSYLTAVSNEENRTFRFGVFQILMTIIPIVAQSISPSLISRYDYAGNSQYFRIFLNNKNSFFQNFLAQ